MDAEEITHPLVFDMRMIFVIYEAITAKCLREFIGGKVLFQVDKTNTLPPLIRLKLVV